MISSLSVWALKLKLALLLGPSFNRSSTMAFFLRSASSSSLMTFSRSSYNIQLNSHEIFCSNDDMTRSLTSPFDDNSFLNLFCCFFNVLAAVFSIPFPFFALSFLPMFLQLAKRDVDSYLVAEELSTACK